MVFAANGQMVGHNTDWSGFAESFRRELGDAPRTRVVQLGAGGAGAAVAHALLTLGAGALAIFDVDRARAARLARDLCARFGAERAAVIGDTAPAIAAADGVVNTTPIGMVGHPGMPVAAATLVRICGLPMSSTFRWRPSYCGRRDRSAAGRWRAGRWRCSRPSAHSGVDRAGAQFGADDPSLRRHVRPPDTDCERHRLLGCRRSPARISATGERKPLSPPSPITDPAPPFRPPFSGAQRAKVTRYQAAQKDTWTARSSPTIPIGAPSSPSSRRPRCRREPFALDPDPSADRCDPVPSFADPHRLADGAPGMARRGQRGRAWPRGIRGRRMGSCARFVAREISRVRHEHGRIMGGSQGWGSAGKFHEARGQLHRFLAACGGFVAQTSNYSFGTALTFLPHILGTAQAVAGPLTSWSSIAWHCRLFVLFGGANPKHTQVAKGGCAWHGTSGSLQHSRRRRSSRQYQSSTRRRAGVVATEWIPIRPNTDTAMMLALAYTLVTEGLHDELPRPLLRRFRKGPAYLTGDRTVCRRMQIGPRQSPECRATQSAGWPAAWRHRAPW